MGSWTTLYRLCTSGKICSRPIIMVHEKITTVKEHILKIKVGTIAVITASAVTVIFGMGISYQKIVGRMNHLDAKTDLYAERYDVIEGRVSNNEKAIDNHYIEIITKLSNIEALLKQ